MKKPARKPKNAIVAGQVWFLQFGPGRTVLRATVMDLTAKTVVLRAEEDHGTPPVVQILHRFNRAEVNFLEQVPA